MFLIILPLLSSISLGINASPSDEEENQTLNPTANNANFDLDGLLDETCTPEIGRSASVNTGMAIQRKWNKIRKNLSDVMDYRCLSKRPIMEKETRPFDPVRAVIERLQTFPLLDNIYIQQVAPVVKPYDTLSSCGFQAPPLLLAVEDGNEKAVKKLLKTECANMTDQFGYTALHYLFYQKWGSCPEITRVRIAIRLLRAGADANMLDVTKKSPLHHACLLGITGANGCANNAIVEMLVRKRRKLVNVNAVDAEGKTPLHYAAKNEFLEILTLLLKRSDILTDIKDKSGNLPFNYACSSKNTEILKTAQEGLYPGLGRWWKGDVEEETKN